MYQEKEEEEEEELIKQEWQKQRSVIAPLKKNQKLAFWCRNSWFLLISLLNSSFCRDTAIIQNLSCVLVLLFLWLPGSGEMNLIEVQGHFLKEKLIFWDLSYLPTRQLASHLVPRMFVPWKLWVSKEAHSLESYWSDPTGIQVGRVLSLCTWPEVASLIYPAFVKLEHPFLPRGPSPIQCWCDLGRSSEVLSSNCIFTELCFIFWGVHSLNTELLGDIVGMIQP